MTRSVAYLFPENDCHISISGLFDLMTSNMCHSLISHCAQQWDNVHYKFKVGQSNQSVLDLQRNVTSRPGL